MTGSAAGLVPLVARPPTPPSENLARPSGDSSNDFIINVANRPLIDTPEESPSSSAEFFRTSSGRLQKKVNFSPYTQYYSMNSNDSVTNAGRKHAPPSKDCNPVRSILKNCIDNGFTLPSGSLLISDLGSVSAMLRSTTQHLASHSRSSRLDAYITLLGCLSAYDDIPETQELVGKVAEITGYIRRDVTSKLDENGSLDIQLATQALKVLTTFVYFPCMAIAIPDDCSLFILERAITCMEDPASPKILVSHYMQLLEKPKFSSKHMSADRVNKLLTALHGVTTRIKGNRIVGHRLKIYQRLITQARSTLASRARNWIDHLFSGMLSPIKDTRLRAITFGVQAGLHLGTTSNVSQACIQIFDNASPGGKKFVDFVSCRLSEMIGSKEDGVDVPQIWSIVVLLLRSRHQQIQRWQHVKLWLGIFQRCLNSSEVRVKFHANIAWNRLIFAVNPDTSTSNSMAKMLRQPIVSSLEQRLSEKHSKQAKQMVQSSYCTLLYYAFRPTASFAQLDQYWDLYIAQVLPSRFVANEIDIDHACEVLTALFSGSGKPKIWDQNRANVAELMQPEELPCLDPKWTRSRVAKILQTFDSLIDVASWHSEEGRESPVMITWRSFTTALANAGSKEIKPSMDTMNAIAHVINETKRVMDRSKLDLPKSCTGEKQEIRMDRRQLNEYERVRFLIREAVVKIGNIPFLERRLILTSQNTFEASETPASRANREKESRNTPTTHILELLLRYAPEPDIADDYRGAVQDVLNIALQPGTSRRTRLSIIRSLARLLSAEDSLSKVANIVLWKLLAEAATSAMGLLPRSEVHDESPQHPGHEFREAVKLLEIGIQLRAPEIISAWQELHDRIARSLRQEIGDDGITLIMTEHLAGVISKGGNDHDGLSLVWAVSICRSVRWPQSCQSMERAQNLLWDALHMPHKVFSVDPFDEIYSMADNLLCHVYESPETHSTSNILAFISAISDMVRVYPSKLQCTIISRLQNGLKIWIEDPKGILGFAEPSSLAGVFNEVEKMASIVLSAIEQCTPHNSESLLQFQGLLISGSQSRHKSILNQTLDVWHRTFGAACDLRYPEDLRTVWSRLKYITDLQLPGFPEVEVDEAMSYPLHFVESQEDNRDTRLQRGPVLLPKGTSMLVGPSLEKRRTVPALRHDPNKATAFPKSPQSARRRIKGTPKARLRHDDSQIQSAAIDSSPFARKTIESDALTDRQREVKERQGCDAAAMFPEIRSSPKSASRSTVYSLPKLNFKADQIQSFKTAIDEDLSPVFPSDVQMNDFLGSSPTPGSSKKDVNSHHFSDDPPSSPPIISSHLDVFHIALSSPYTAQDVGLAAMSEVTDISNIGDKHSDIKSAGGILGPMKPAQTESNIYRAQDPAAVFDMHIHLPNGRIMSDFDMCVNAASEPTSAESHLAVSQGQDEVSKVTNHVEIQDSHRNETEDDQVTAQLIGEMEKASSQQSQLLQAITKPPSTSQTSARKRKRVLDYPPKVKKRIRRAASLSSSQQNMETPKAGELVADCVLIEARIPGSNHAKTPLEIKREQSPSPSLITDSQFAEISNTNQKPRGRTRGHSRADGTSQVNSSAAMTSGKNEIKLEKEEIAGMCLDSPARNTRNSKRKSMMDIDNPRGISNLHDQNLENGTDPLALDTDNGIAPGKENTVCLASIPASPPNQATPPFESPKVAHEVPNQNNPGNIAESRGLTPTPYGILQGFKEMLTKIKRVALGPEEEREIVGILFESVKEVHDAGRRSTAKQ